VVATCHLSMPYSFSASLLFGSCFFFFLVDHVCVVAPQTSLFLSCTWSYMDVVSLFIKLGGSLFQGDFVTVEVATCATGVSWLRIVLLWASWSMLKSQWFLVINTSMRWSSNADVYLVHGSDIISVHLIWSSHFMHAFVFFFGGSKRFDSTFVRGLSLGILCSMILGSHSLDQTAHGALQIFDMRLLPLIMNDVYKMALRRRAHRYLHKLFFFWKIPFAIVFSIPRRTYVQNLGSLSWTMPWMWSSPWYFKISQTW
jgi:hypothetical protein